MVARASQRRLAVSRSAGIRWSDDAATNAGRLEHHWCSDGASPWRQSSLLSPFSSFANSPASAGYSAICTAGSVCEKGEGYVSICDRSRESRDTLGDDHGRQKHVRRRDCLGTDATHGAGALGDNLALIGIHVSRIMQRLCRPPSGPSADKMFCASRVAIHRPAGTRKCLQENSPYPRMRPVVMALFVASIFPRWPLSAPCMRPDTKRSTMC